MSGDKISGNKPINEQQYLELLKPEANDLDGDKKGTVKDKEAAVKAFRAAAGKDELLSPSELPALKKQLSKVKPELLDGLFVPSSNGKRTEETSGNTAKSSETAPAKLNASNAELSAWMSQMSPEAQRSFYDQYASKSSQSFEQWQAQLTTVRQGIELNPSVTVVGVTTQEPSEIQRYISMGYIPARMESIEREVTLPTTTRTETLPVGVRGGSDLFELGGYKLSALGKEKIMEALANEGVFSHFVFKAGTDKVEVKDELLADLQRYTAEPAFLEFCAKHNLAFPSQTKSQQEKNALLCAVRLYELAQLVPVEHQANARFEMYPYKSSTRAKEDPAARFVELSFDVTKSVTVAEPHTEKVTVPRMTLIKPPPTKPLELSDHVLFALDISGSIDRSEKLAMLKQQLLALESKNYDNVTYEFVTFDHRGNVHQYTLSGRPEEVIEQMATKAGLKQRPATPTDKNPPTILGEIRSFIKITPGPVGRYDTDANEPLAKMNGVAEKWIRETRATGATPTVLVCSDIDRGRQEQVTQKLTKELTKEIKDQPQGKVVFFNPADAKSR